jgi:hypothetical protein
MVTRLCFAVLLMVGPSAVNAQTMHETAKIDTSAAVAAAHLQAQGYSDIHDLHKNADGTWTAQAMYNGTSTTVTEGADGRVSGR